MEYDHQKIEKKWQKIWEEKSTFKSTLDESKPKYYVLDMFPYPSGAGLHVGHPEGMIATDIMSRYKRRKGYNVLHPYGWDSFGLPAENFAIKTGIHPEISTKKNIETYKKQVQSLGFSYDWDREFSTTDTDYYKWTQWVFLELYKKDLAYEKEMPMNWCNTCKIVVANEEVENGVHERCGLEVVKKNMRQWMLKITKYADRLLEDIEGLDWEERIKEMQRNWIGKSYGAEVDFIVCGDDTQSKKDQVISVYTTRIDTIFSGTFLILAPEHSLLEEITIDEKKEEVYAYRDEALQKSELDRKQDVKEKTGVFTGAYAVNPATSEKIPVWVADFVLKDYGTGAVFADAHDQRDFEMAKQYGIPLKVSIKPDDEELWEKVKNFEECFSGYGTLVHSGEFDGMTSEESKPKIIEWLGKKGLAKKTTNYKLRDWVFTRQRYWGEPIPLVYDNEGNIYPLDESELPLILPATDNYLPTDSGESPLAKIEDFVNVKGYITSAGTVKTVQNESEAQNESIISFKRETLTMPNWAGSSWYYLRFMDPKNSQEAWSKEAENYWGQVDLYVGGAEHAVLHLLYARFWHKVLFDLGYVNTKEPFQKLKNQGMILAFSYRDKNHKYYHPSEVVEKNGECLVRETGEILQRQIEKMSKSKYNVVNPDDVVAEYGADTLRLYEMFMGPFEQTVVWDTKSILGVRRFLEKVVNLSQKISSESEVENDAIRNLLHKTIKKVSSDTENFKFNTAISSMMVLVNEMQKQGVTKSYYEILLLLLNPYAPHVTEELWEQIGNKQELTFSKWPEFNEEYCIDDEITIVVQVNGKLRDEIKVSADISKEEILNASRSLEKVQQFIAPGIKREIYVPGKLVNFVV